MASTTEISDPYYVSESPLKKAKIDEEDIGGSGSVEHNSDSSDDEESKNLNEYWRQINESDGFYVDPEIVPWGSWSIICPIDLDDKEGDAYWAGNAKRATMLAVAEHNQNNEEKLEVKDFVRANNSDGLYHVTFLAENLSTGVTSTYQTEVFYRYYQGDESQYSLRVSFIRPEPKKIVSASS